MLGVSTGQLLVILGACSVMMKPSDMIKMARVAGRMTGRAVGRLMLYRRQMDDIFEQTAAKKINTELQDAMSKLQSIGYEVQNLSRITPGQFIKRQHNTEGMAEAGTYDGSATKVLDLSETEIMELPSSFHQLRQLLYLCVNRWIRVRYGAENLKSVQELKSVILMSPSVLLDLSGLTELRRLHMEFIGWDKSFEEPFERCLSNLINLQILKVSGCHMSRNSGCESLQPGSQQLRCITAKHRMAVSVPRWMSSLSSLSNLWIELYTLGAEDLHVLACIPCLSYLNLQVSRGTRQRQEWLVIDAGYPFRCLTEFRYGMTVEVVFTPGAMQKLQTLELHLQARNTMHQSGYFDLGMENLSSLQKVTIDLDCYKAEPEEVEAAKAAFHKALDMNPNKPTLNFE